MLIKVKQNGGSDSAGFDNFKLAGTAKSQCVASSSLFLITGVYDGPLSGGTPKGVELYATKAISDLSEYGIGSANNGGGSDGEEFTFPSIALEAGTYIYVTANEDSFETFFGFQANFISGSLAINGDDAIELFNNGNVVDVFGDINTDGSGEVWEYQDGWAYRKDKIGSNAGSFDAANWIFSGSNAWDNEISNSTAASKMSIGEYITCGETTAPADKEAPSAPTNLTADNISANTLELNWNAATDNVSVTKYEVYQNGALIGSTNELMFNVTDLEADTNYTFTVVAIDGANNSSEPSSGLEVKTLASSGTISIANARQLPEGAEVTITGILTVSDQFGGPAFIQDNSGGIAVFDSTLHGDGLFAIGDELTITATRANFNDQVQLTDVTAIETSTTGIAIEPIVITASQIQDYAGQLVTIKNVNFNNTNGLFCGNTNFDFSDATGTTELRIDNDVEDLIGIGVPDTCEQITGVVGRFRDFFQLLPRFGADLPCSGGFEPQQNPNGNSDVTTLDVLTWNIEWFGDGSNFGTPSGITSAETQKNAVKAIIEDIQPDLIAVQEIANPELFNTLVSELAGYEAILSEATSYPNDTDGISQQVGFIYNTNTITANSSKPLFTDVHPYYNAGDASAILDFPDTDKTRFYASGRLPFAMNATVSANNNSEDITFIVYHARANSGNDSQSRYDMRKYDVNFLKTYIDNELADDNVILLGDFNDDVDVTVADVTTIESTYSAFTMDANNYNVVTSTLSDAGYNSFAFNDNIIDHILISDELFDNFISMSSTIWNQYYDCDFTNTTSDHFPISARFTINTPLTINTIETENVSCNSEADGKITVTATGGTAPYSYQLNSGAFENNTGVFTNLEAGIYTISVKDSNDLVISTTALEITEPEALEVLITENQNITVENGVETCIDLSVLTSNETENNTFNYSWSTGETTKTITVCPTETTIYTLTANTETGCTITKTVEVAVTAIDPIKVESEVVPISCTDANDGAINLTISGGLEPYTINWNTGDDLNVLTNLSAGSYSVTITDSANQTVTEAIELVEPQPIEVTLTNNNSVFNGISEATCKTIGVTDSNETADNTYSYQWNTGETTATISACTTETTDYTVTIINENGCERVETITVNVEDIRCNAFKVKMCLNGREICVPNWFVGKYKALGATLGSCVGDKPVKLSELKVFPNPFKISFYTLFRSSTNTKIDFVIYNQQGRVVLKKSVKARRGKNYTRFNLFRQPPGFYYVKASVNGTELQTQTVFKR